MNLIHNIAHGNDIHLLSNYTKLIPKYSRKLVAEYIWIGGKGNDLRSKSTVLNTDKVTHISELPNWSFDGSSTGQALGHDSEVILKPVKYVSDPFREQNHILVLCECLTPSLEPIESNRRAKAREIFDNNEVKLEEPWFGLEQEYTLFTPDNLRPLGFPLMGLPNPQGQYYCALGVDNAFGRHLSEAHMFACLYCGLDISGTNAEVMPGSWEYQIGPSIGIDAADQLWLARYIMERIAEDFQIKVSLSPKPMQGDWNGAGCHCNFSSKSTRDKNGINNIIECMEYLEKNHLKHMENYGEDNQLRMTGIHETATFDKFSWGIADRGCSVRIPRNTEANKCGHFEDRRPAANCEPYDVVSLLAETCILDKLNSKTN